MGTMYDAWCDECGGYLYTESHGVVTDEWESRDAAERVMRQHQDSNDAEYGWHTVYVSRRPPYRSLPYRRVWVW